MISRDTATHVRHFVLGMVFLTVIAVFIGTTIAIYAKVFTPGTRVSLRTDHIGNQMDIRADVKIRGMIVGEVRDIRATDTGAALELALQPDKINLIPSNVSAQLLPKTLFGQRYVDLQLPRNPAAEHLEDGAVISQDHSSSSIETEQVLNHLMPVLQAVQPEKLSTTLSAVSSALEGRGKSLGDTLVELNGLLERFNPSLPDLKANIASLTTVSDVYNQAAPEFLQALRKATTTSKTIADQRARLQDLYQSVSGGSQTLTDFVDANSENLISLTVASRPALDVLAKYAPEYPCLLSQMSELIPKVDKGFGKGTDKPHMLHAHAEISSSRGKYEPGKDTPRFDDQRGPRCYPQMPYPQRFPQYVPGGPLKDGASKPAPADVNSSSLGTVLGAPPSSGNSAPQGAPVSIANSPQEHRLLSSLLAPRLQLMPSEVPAWSGLLVGPLYRGGEVTVR